MILNVEVRRAQNAWYGRVKWPLPMPSDAGDDFVCGKRVPREGK